MTQQIFSWKGKLQVKTLTYVIILIGLLPQSLFASAMPNPLTDDGSGGVFGVFLGNVISFASGVLVPFLIGIGFLVFVWGMFLYFIAGGANPQKQELGKQVLLYSLLGFVLIIIFWGIINLIAVSTGLQNDAGQIPGLVPEIKVF